MAVLKYCARCGGLVNQSHKHRKKDERPSARRRGYDAQHQRDRVMFLGAFPVCQWHEGCIEPATELDHIDGDPHNKSWGNYRGYCRRHHGQRTAQDQPGGWNAPGYRRTYEEE